MGAEETTEITDIMETVGTTNIITIVGTATIGNPLCNIKAEMPTKSTIITGSGSNIIGPSRELK
jgi:hypothetical protein